MGHRHADLPNTDWIAANHWCAPLYYHPRPNGESTEGTWT
jgi:hypothetical protein